MLSAILLRIRIVTSLLCIAFACSPTSAMTYSTLVETYGGIFPRNPAWTPEDNTREFNELIRSLTGDHSTKTIRFASGTYQFNVNVEGGGQLAAFENVGNLTLLGADDGNTTLSWYSADAGNGSHAPQSLLNFDLNCRAIMVQQLTFDTPYTVRYGTGQHLRFVGKHLSVNYCTFRHSPNFAVQISDGNADDAPEYVHISSNSFINCNGDPIHIHNGSEIWIVGNYIENSGDDAIAIVADDFTSDGLKASGVHIISNTINGSKWRGIAVITADDVNIHGNYIHGAARHGIEIVPISSEHGTLFDGDVPENQWAHNIRITDNTIQYAGYPPDHGNNFHADAAGINQKNARNVTATGNYIHNVKGHGIYLRWITDSEYGSLSQIWSFGTSGTGDGIKGEGYLDNITTWFYYPGN